MDKGLCPHCNAELIFDSTDISLGVVECPVCHNIFLFAEVGDENSSENPLRIFAQTIHNQDGTIRANAGYKAKITSVKLNKTVNVSGDNKYRLFTRIREEADKLKEQERRQRVESQAMKKTKNAEEKIKDLEKILSVKTSFKWEELKREDVYPEEKPVFEKVKPQESEAEPFTNIFEKIFKTYREKREQKRKIYFKEQLKIWKEAKKSFEENLDKWNKDKESFDKEKEKFNKSIDKKVDKQKKGETVFVEEFFRKLLEKSEMPEDFPKKFDLGYKEDEKILIIEYVLPNYEDIPNSKGLKYIKTRGVSEPIKISKTERERLYNNVLYSIPLRRLNEIFSNDIYDNVDSVVFNGWIDTVDKATGNNKTICILTLHVKKEDFEKINLKNVDPKECFKGLKGVGSSKLSSLAPVAPILNLDKEDKRFIKGQEVLEGVDDAVNVAAMDWEDFEHLVREVFEEEFAQSGMEVKVTQSSRDLGVDAVAFDPDPFRGGKIIIQAKRYSNTVKVESVRALYGIMQDEGAMKGILVTTSDYGPDAYKFAQGKPITLINGNNLLSMLEKYGHKARIDLKEAKQALNGKTR